MEPSTSAVRRVPLIPVITSIVAALIVALAAWSATRDTTGEPIGAVPDNVSEGFGVVHGAVDAPVKVVVYADFRCPSCAQFDAMQGPAVDELVEAGTVSVEHRILTFLDTYSTTKFSTRAMNTYVSMATHADAEATDTFRRLVLLAQSSDADADLSDDDLLALVHRAGAPKEVQSKVRADVKERTYEQWTVEANDAASKAGVHRTPYVMIDGVVVEYPFNDFVDQVTAAAKATSTQETK